MASKEYMKKYRELRKSEAAVFMAEIRLEIATLKRRLAAVEDLIVELRNETLRTVD